MLKENTIPGAIVTVTDHRGCSETSTYTAGAEGANSARDDWDPFHAIPFGSHGDRGYGDPSVLYPSQIACDARFYDARNVSCIVSLRGAGAIVG